MALYHILNNNEKEFVNYIDKTEKKDKLILFDIGTNRGLYIDLFLKLTHNVDIYGFEPITSLYNNLIRKYCSNNIKINNLAVSNSLEIIPFYELLDAVTDGCSSLIERPVFNERNWKYVKKSIQSTTIDAYCKLNNIPYIDFLKIDVEGAEFMVLLGAENMLKNKKIHYIQFEYGGTFEDANISLLDVYNLIIKYDYKLFYFNNNEFYELNNNNISTYVERNESFDFIIK